MDFGKLPDAVITCLFSYMPEETIMPKERFSSSLYFLAVSQQWRYVALPMAYRTLFVEANSNHGSSRHGDPSFDVSDARLTSNIDLAANSGYLRYTRKIEFAIYFAYNPLICIQAVLNLLKLYQQDWPYVSAIELWYIQHCSHYSEDNEDNLPLNKYESEVDAIKQQFIKLMPSLKSIIIKSCADAPIIQEVNKQITLAYGSSLSKLYLEDGVPLLNPGAFTQLTHVDINVDEGRMKALPFICAETLIKLHLRSCPVDFIWVNTLDSDSVGSPNIVEFPCLQHLTIDFENSSESNAGYSHSKLNFPKLQYMSFKYGNIGLFLDYAILPDTMHTVKINGSANDMKKLTQVNLPKIQKFDIKASFYEKCEMQTVIECADYIVAQQYPLPSVKITLIGVLAPLNNDGVLPQSITEVDISASTNVQQLIGMLKSPKVKNIKVDYLVFKDTPRSAMFMDQKPTNGEKVVPYTSQLESLFIRLNQGYSANVILPVLYNLLLKLPALKAFTTNREYNGRVKEFIEKYKCQYPHLGNIKVVQG